MRRLSEAAVDNLAELHAVDYRAAGLGDFGQPAGYVERQVGGWSERYRKARTDDVPELDAPRPGSPSSSPLRPRSRPARR